MEVRNCRKCGRMFNYLSGPVICPACRDAIEAKFQEVKKYIQQNGKASMHEISEECDVDTGQIQQWIREERLQFSDDSPIRVACESCGKMIGSGKYCNECKEKMMHQLNGAMGKHGIAVESPKETHQKSAHNRMRFLDN